LSAPKVLDCVEIDVKFDDLDDINTVMAGGRAKGTCTSGGTVKGVAFS